MAYKFTLFVVTHLILSVFGQIEDSVSIWDHFEIRSRLIRSLLMKSRALGNLMFMFVARQSRHHDSKRKYGWGFHSFIPRIGINVFRSYMNTRFLFETCISPYYSTKSC